MGAILDDQAVIQRVLDHIEQGTTDRGDRVWHEPVAHYHDPARFDAELAVFRRFDTPFCPSACLPEAGSYLARTAAGTPLVVVRGTDGVVRGFRNACRHRGMTVAQGAGKLRNFYCRYHGWSYSLDGALRQVPHEDGFPQLDHGQHGLVPVTTTERLGMVFVRQDGPAIADDSLAGLAPFFHGGQQLFDTRETDIDVNWKLLLEGFIEGYHIKTTHPKSFLPYGYDNLNIIDRFGRNSRVTYPFQRIRKLADVPPAQRRIDGLLTYVYHLFPNTLVVRLSRHVNLIVLEPLSPTRTRQYTYKLSLEAGEQALAEARRDADFVNDVGLEEDRAVIQQIQAGLHSGANQFFTFGQFESAIVHFHQQMTALLD